MPFSQYSLELLKTLEIEIRNWQRNFVKQNSCKPNKNDIDAANMSGSYKEYQKLKKLKRLSNSFENSFNSENKENIKKDCKNDENGKKGENSENGEKNEKKKQKRRRSLGFMPKLDILKPIDENNRRKSDISFLKNINNGQNFNKGNGKILNKNDENKENLNKMNKKGENYVKIEKLTKNEKSEKIGFDELYKKFGLTKFYSKIDKNIEKNSKIAKNGQNNEKNAKIEEKGEKGENLIENIENLEILQSSDSFLIPGLSGLSKNSTHSNSESKLLKMPQKRKILSKIYQNIDFNDKKCKNYRKIVENGKNCEKCDKNCGKKCEKFAEKFKNCEKDNKNNAENDFKKFISKIDLEFNSNTAQNRFKFSTILSDFSEEENNFSPNFNEKIDKNDQKAKKMGKIDKNGKKLGKIDKNDEKLEILSQPFKKSKKLNTLYKQSINQKRGKYKRRRLSGILPANKGRSFYSKSCKKYQKIMKKKIEIENFNDELYCDLLDVQDLVKFNRPSSESENSEEISDKENFEYYEKNENNKKIKINDLIKDFSNYSINKVLKEIYGFDDFREGQKRIIKTILKNESCLAIMPTGAGKSLCYQIPALIKPGLVLVVSPLISLMQDQLEKLPKELPGAIWSSFQNSKKILEIMQKLQSGSLKILFISPERFGSFGFQKTMGNLPPEGISFICIDEAHCISQWSHNFRPAYLTLNKKISSKFAKKPLLALTATATKATKREICHLMKISEKNVIKIDFFRKNLNITISPREPSRGYGELLSILKSERFRYLKSIIVYVSLRSLSEEIASFLRINGLDALAYNAGKSQIYRKNTQRKFMRGSLRIIVATIAFGMGLDKPDVRAVVHFNFPKSIENYVQEIGRAGRDFLPAECHCFYTPSDIKRSKELIESNRVSKEQIKLILESVFYRKNGKNGKNCFKKKIMRKNDEFSTIKIDDIEKIFELNSSVFNTVIAKINESHEFIEQFPNFHNFAVLGFLIDPLTINDQKMVNLIKNEKERNGIYRLNLAQLQPKTGLSLCQFQHCLIKMKAEKQIWLKWEQNSLCFKIKKSIGQNLNFLIDAINDSLLRFERSQSVKTELIEQLAVLGHSKKSEKILNLIDLYFNCENEEKLLNDLKKNKLSDSENLFKKSD